MCKCYQAEWDTQNKPTDTTVLCASLVTLRPLAPERQHIDFCGMPPTVVHGASCWNQESSGLSSGMSHSVLLSMTDDLAHSPEMPNLSMNENKLCA